YVDSLIGPNTVNTIPPSTFDEFLAKGKPALTVTSERAEGTARLTRLAAMGIDLDDVTASLLEDGLSAFSSAYRALIAEIDRKRNALS
ncbi:MAG: transaldolase family protein, partial [Aminobacteriaceae bacterium]